MVRLQQLPVGGAATQDRLGAVVDDVLCDLVAQRLEPDDAIFRDTHHVRVDRPNPVGAVGASSFLGGLLARSDGSVQPGEEVLALADHATAEMEGTVAETLDTGVIFTVESRVSLSDRGYPRVL